MRLDVTSYGATSGADCTRAIQASLDAVHAAGGGTVVVPAGRWRCGGLRLRSHSELHLEHGAVLAGIADPALYPATPGSDQRAMITALDEVDVAITGSGRIDGDGDSRRWGKDADPNEFRFSLIRCIGCRNVRILDVGLWWTRWWGAHLLRCEDVQIRGCEIVARRDRINADGIDPDDCRRVRISDCRIATGDDAIVIKSTSGGVCEDILVSDCILESSCAAIKVGTESVGTIRNVVFDNCIVRDSAVGLAVFLKDGGTYQSLVMRNCVVEACNDFPILIDHTPRFHGETPAGVLEGVVIADCRVRSSGRLWLGAPAGAPLRDVRIERLDWTCPDPVVYGPTTDRPQGAGRVRLDPAWLPAGTTPHHCILRHVEDVQIRDLRLHVPAGDPRRLLRATGCRNVRVQAEGLHGDGLVELLGCSNVEAGTSGSNALPLRQ